MLIKDVFYTDKNFKIQHGNLTVESGMVYTRSLPGANSEELVAEPDFIVVPGFIDVHTHGAVGVDTCDADTAGYGALSNYYAQHGVTSFCPTTMTESPEKLKSIFAAVSEFKGTESGAYVHGINMEGPYISPEKKGAQNAIHIRKPDFDEFLHLNRICHVSLVDIAPEVEGALEFAEKASSVCTVSAAHTDADSKTARAAFAGGFTHVTHMFNAMRGVTAREPGIPGIAVDRGVTAELICDGFHVAEEVLRQSFLALAKDRAVVVSDSIRSAGCPDGEYELGGQKVFVKDGRARLADGTIAGSTTNLFDEFLFLLDIGIPFEDALRACTINPACAIGVSDKTGSIDDGKAADLLILDADLNIFCVMVKGKVVYKNVL